MVREVNLRCQPATTCDHPLALAPALLKDVAIVWQIRSVDPDTRPARRNAC